jgi:hypothetical protein
MRWQDNVSKADYNMNIDGDMQPWDGSHSDTHAQPASPINQPLPLGKQVSNLDHIVCLLLTSLVTVYRGCMQSTAVQDSQCRGCQSGQCSGPISTNSQAQAAGKLKRFDDNDEIQENSTY